MTADLPQIIAQAIGHGAEFRIAGADVTITGERLPHGLHTALQAANASGALHRHLAGDAAAERAARAVLNALGVRPILIETVRDAKRATRRLIRDLRAFGGMLGVDCETTPRAGCGAPRPAVRINMDGTPAKRQPKLSDRTALDAHRAQIATLQAYGGGDVCFVFRGEAMRMVAGSRWLRRQHIVAHSAGFELSFLAQHVRPAPPIPRRPGTLQCSMQAAGLLLGVGFGGSGRSLARAALEFLGIDVAAAKPLALSDWGAQRLTAGQVAYAAADAIVAWQLWPRLEYRLRQTGRWPAYELQTGAVPAICAMQARGIGLDVAEHARQVADWSRDLAMARQEFHAESGRPVPTTPAEIRTWLQAVLSPDELLAWPVTGQTKALTTAAGNLKRIGHVPGALALVRVIGLETLLQGFGEPLLRYVHNGRVHPHFQIAASKSGRFTCNNPNLQQMPGQRAPQFRRCIVAGSGRVLVCCDYSQIELRAAAWISGDPELTRIYVEGLDLHAETAAMIARIAPGDVTPAMRQSAKPTNFGAIFGIGASSLAADAFVNYDINMSEAAAAHALDAFFRRFRVLDRWRHAHADLCQRRGYILIGCGRVHKAEWEPSGYLSFPQCCNLPVQGIAADCMLRAIRLAHRRLLHDRVRGGLIATIHDELIAEVIGADAERARQILERSMLEAFIETFPGAPTRGVAVAKIGRTWAEAKG